MAGIRIRVGGAAREAVTPEGAGRPLDPESSGCTVGGTSWIWLDPPEAREHWRTSPRHAYAAGELAPRHYTVVRLHRGRLAGGLLPEPSLLLEETKYYDFRGPTPWRAIRRLVPGR